MTCPTDVREEARDPCSGLSALWQPFVVVPVVNTAVALAYLWGDMGRITFHGAVSLAASFLAGIAFYFVVIAAAPRRRWLAAPVAVLLALGLTAVHTLYLGYYRIFRSLLPVSALDYARQMPAHGLGALREYFSVSYGLAGLACASALTFYFYRAMIRRTAPIRPRALMAATLGWVVLALVAVRPYLSIDQHFANGLILCLRGAGRTSVHFIPDRADLPPLHSAHPVNVVFVQLESISRDAMQVYAPELPTSPFWADLLKEHPDEVFVARRHFANSSASDVAIPMLHTGAGADDAFHIHKTTPLLWDYAKAAGYDTALSVPYALSWGDFHIRFQHHDGHMNLDHVVHADNAGRPLVHDMSINDADVLAASLDYLRGRQWSQPFLVVMNFKMPHFLGRGAHLNGFSFLNDRLPGEERLINFYNAVYHNDDLTAQFFHAMPPEVRRNTVIIAVSDHGEDLYGRGARLENFHVEIALVPCLFYIPSEVQARLTPQAIANLRRTTETIATSNLDVLPTLVDLMGLADDGAVAPLLAQLQGQSLLRPYTAPEFIVMLNTNDLRRWEREAFALTMDDGRLRYVYDMGRESLHDLDRDPREQRNLIGDPAYSDWLRRARDRARSNPYLLRVLRKYGGP